MKLFLIAYANAAVVGPVVWIGVRLWTLGKSKPLIARYLGTAQIIPFPRIKTGTSRTRPV